MAERKGTPNRGSLMDMAKPRLAQSPLSVPLDEVERRILTAESDAEDTSGSSRMSGPEQEYIRRDVHANVQTPALTTSRTDEHTDLLAKLRKERQTIAVVGFKLPASLKEELLAVAQHNKTDMTRLVVAALERLLPELPHPPEWKKR
jgi:hypothetical protein